MSNGDVVLKRLEDYKGKVYDLSYNPKELVYNSVSDFVNHISDIEIDLAMKDLPDVYEEDDIYIKYKRLKDSQMISDKELTSLLEDFGYEIYE